MTDPCGQCGQLHLTYRGHPSCTGHVVHDRASYVKGQDRKKLDKPRPCRADALTGATVCKNHGGSRQVKTAGQRRHAERAAERIMRRFGEPIDTTPTEALLDTVRWTAGYVAWLRDKVAAVDSDDDLVWGRTREKSGGDDYGTTEEAKPNAWLALLGEWHDKLVKVCAEAIRCGIEERRVRLAEQQGQLVAGVIRRILDDLDLTAEQARRVPDVVPRHLRALAAS